MADEFIEIPGADDRPIKPGRRSVRIFLLGNAEDVERIIAELHSKQFGEAGLWSRSLQFSQIQQQFALQPGEVMRVYKRYLTW
ncbi:MAG: hypothetical protein Kow00121_06830 [Elainellaceae cyanobacterium]